MREVQIYRRVSFIWLGESSLISEQLEKYTTILNDFETIM